MNTNSNLPSNKGNFKQQYKFVEKQHKKIENETKIEFEYTQCLNNYRSFFQVKNMSIFEYPEIFIHFHLFRNTLYFKFNSVSICLSDERAIEHLFRFNNLPYLQNDKIINDLLHSLIKFLKIKKVSSYLDYVNQYKSENNINYECILDHPVENFPFLDDNLCFNDHTNKRLIAITDEFIQYLFKKNNMPLSTYLNRKKIFRSLVKMARESTKIRNDLSNPENPYYINYSVNVKSEVNVSKGNEAIPQYIDAAHISIEYNKNNKTFIHKKVLYDPYLNYKYTPIIKDLVKYSETYYPKHFSKLLYALTDGNLETVDKLSEAFAYILAERNISKRLTTFYVHEKEEIIAMLLGNTVDFKASTMSLKAICDSKNIKKLINLKLSGTFLNISIDSNLPNFENANILNKILNSKPVSARDGFLGNKTFVNNMHLVYITNKDMNIIKLSNNYNINLIKLNTASDDLQSLISNYESDQAEVDWVRTNFALHGLKHIAERDLGINSNPIKATKSKEEISNGIKCFISECCKITPEGECVAADIYKLYVEYYKKFYGGEPLPKLKFRNVLIKKNNYTYCRPHHSSKGPNKYAFLGISIDQDKLNTVMSKKEKVLQNDSNKLKIEEHLRSMNNLFNNINL